MSPAAFAHPDWWPYLGGALGVAAAALVLAALRARRRARRLLGVGAGAAGRELLRDLLLWGALAALAVALLGPRIAERTVRAPRAGVDVVLLFDVSLSMDAQDVPPSRLDRARRAARDILRALRPGDRAALAAYAGIGALLVPLTPDTSAIAEMLASLDSELIRQRGSRLEEGVSAAVEAFEADGDRPRVLVVLSDGEDPERRGDAGANAAAQAGVRIVAAAFGTELGTTVPEHGVPHRDAAGRIVVSRRDAERLGELARATGGALFEADAWGVIDVAAAAAAIRRDAGGADAEAGERRVRVANAAPFAALAFALLVAELAPFAALRAARPGGRGRRAAALVLLSAALVAAAAPEPSLEVRGLESAARAAPNDPDVLLQLGYARAMDGLLDDSIHAFHAAALYARDPELVALAYYDLGVVALANGELRLARDAFFDVLALTPGDAEARYNLEWVVRELAKTPAPRHTPRDEDRGAPEDGSAAAEGAASTPDAAAFGGARAADAAGFDALALSPADAERWLETLDDDASRALRAAARAAGERASQRPDGAPTW
ncbi:MAG: VWA domain-containing protein [Deltaproteobacteria bacterium]|nr:MAG: VWA domain-containing protein [Deltaproteobacteria bacterium]